MADDQADSTPVAKSSGIEAAKRRKTEFTTPGPSARNALQDSSVNRDRQQTPLFARPNHFASLPSRRSCSSQSSVDVLFARRRQHTQENDTPTRPYPSLEGPSAASKAKTTFPRSISTPKLSLKDFHFTPAKPTHPTTPMQTIADRDGKQMHGDGGPRAERPNPAVFATPRTPTIKKLSTKTPGQSGQRRTKPERDALVVSARQMLKTYRFFFDCLESPTIVQAKKQLKELGSHVEVFRNKKVTHIIVLTLPKAAGMTLTRTDASASKASASNLSSATKPLASRLKGTTPQASPIGIPTKTPRRESATPKASNGAVTPAPSRSPKVWDLQRLVDLLQQLNEQEPERKLQDHLREERIYGVSTARDVEQEAIPFHVFRERYVLLEDFNEAYRPILIREYKDTKNPAAARWPYIDLRDRQGMCAFHRRPTSETVSDDAGSGDDKHMEERVPLADVVAPAPAVSKEQPPLPPVTPRRAFQGISAASGLVTMSAALPPREVLETRSIKDLGNRQLAVPTTKRREKSTTKAKSVERVDVVTAPPAGKIFYTRPGLCENCNVKYDVFQEHVNSSVHRLWLSQANFQDLDHVLERLKRPRKAGLQEEQDTSEPPAKVRKLDDGLAPLNEEGETNPSTLARIEAYQEQKRLDAVASTTVPIETKEPAASRTEAYCEKKGQVMHDEANPFVERESQKPKVIDTSSPPPPPPTPAPSISRPEPEPQPEDNETEIDIVGTEPLNILTEPATLNSIKSPFLPPHKIHLSYDMNTTSPSRLSAMSSLPSVTPQKRRRDDSMFSSSMPVRRIRLKMPPKVVTASQQSSVADARPPPILSSFLPPMQVSPRSTDKPRMAAGKKFSQVASSAPVMNSPSGSGAIAAPAHRAADSRVAEHSEMVDIGSFGELAETSSKLAQNSAAAHQTARGTTGLLLAASTEMDQVSKSVERPSPGSVEAEELDAPSQPAENPQTKQSSPAPTKVTELETAPQLGEANGVSESIGGQSSPASTEETKFDGPCQLPSVTEFEGKTLQIVSPTTSISTVEDEYAHSLTPSPPIEEEAAQLLTSSPPHETSSASEEADVTPLPSSPSQANDEVEDTIDQLSNAMCSNEVMDASQLPPTVTDEAQNESPLRSCSAKATESPCSEPGSPTDVATTVGYVPQDPPLDSELASANAMIQEDSVGPRAAAPLCDDESRAQHQPSSSFEDAVSATEKIGKLSTSPIDDDAQDLRESQPSSQSTDGNLAEALPPACSTPTEKDQPESAQPSPISFAEGEAQEDSVAGSAMDVAEATDEDTFETPPSSPRMRPRDHDVENAPQLTRWRSSPQSEAAESHGSGSNCFEGEAKEPSKAASPPDSTRSSDTVQEPLKSADDPSSSDEDSGEPTDLQQTRTLPVNISEGSPEQASEATSIAENMYELSAVPPSPGSQPTESSPLFSSADMKVRASADVMTSEDPLTAMSVGMDTSPGQVIPNTMEPEPCPAEQVGHYPPPLQQRNPHLSVSSFSDMSMMSDPPANFIYPKTFQAELLAMINEVARDLMSSDDIPDEDALPNRAGSLQPPPTLPPQQPRFGPATVTHPPPARQYKPTAPSNSYDPLLSSDPLCHDPQGDYVRPLLPDDADEMPGIVPSSAYPQFQQRAEPETPTRWSLPAHTQLGPGTTPDVSLLTAWKGVPQYSRHHIHRTPHRYHSSTHTGTMSSAFGTPGSMTPNNVPLTPQTMGHQAYLRMLTNAATPPMLQTRSSPVGGACEHTWDYTPNAHHTTVVTQALPPFPVTSGVLQRPEGSGPGQQQKQQHPHRRSTPQRKTFAHLPAQIPPLPSSQLGHQILTPPAASQGLLSIVPTLYSNHPLPHSVRDAHRCAHTACPPSQVSIQNPNMFAPDYVQPGVSQQARTTNARHLPSGETARPPLRLGSRGYMYSSST